MSKFTFICDHTNPMCSGPVVTVETDKDYLNDVLEDFEMFLRGCGFFFDGHLEIVDHSLETGCKGDCDGGYDAD